MFSCPTAVDEYFSRKISNLDLNFNKSDGSLRYQQRVSFQERVKEAEDTKKRYPNKVPLVIEKHKSDKTLPHIDKVRCQIYSDLYLQIYFQIKWLVPQEMSLAQLTGVIKQRIKCPPHQELFLTLNHQR